MNNLFENTVEKIFVINLDKDKKRLEYIKKQFSYYGYNDIERIPGILGKNLPDKDEYMKKLSNFHNNRCSAYGIAKSHMSIFKKMLDENINTALILEDDIKLTPLIKHFKKIYNQLPNDWDLVWVGNSRSKWPKNTCTTIPIPSYDYDSLNKINDNIYKIENIDKTYNYPMGAYAYLVNIKIVKKLIENYDYQRAIDVYLIENNFSNRYIIVPSMIIHCFDFGSYSSNTDLHYIFSKNFFYNNKNSIEICTIALILIIYISFNKYKYNYNSLKNIFYEKSYSIISLFIITFMLTDYLINYLIKKQQLLTDNPFEYIWKKNKEGYNDLIYMLNNLYDEFNKHNIEYMPAYGTLLGLERHGDLIPWDDDVDLWINEKDFDKVVKQILPYLETNYKINYTKINHKKLHGLKIKLFLNKNKKIKNSNSFFNETYDYSWPFVDLFIYKRIDNIIYDLHFDKYNGTKLENIPRNDIHILTENFKLYDINMNGIKFKSLSKNNNQTILNKFFKNWKNDCISSNWDHINEREKYSIKTQCKFLIIK